MLDQRIYTFLAVCENMNYTRAAEVLHITQPAVSHQIKSLENQYGVQLFVYENKRLTLTPAGSLLLRSAVTISNDEKLTSEQITRSSQRRLSLRFGTTLTIADFAIFKPLSAYIQNHPDTDIRMLVANTDELLRQLRSCETHFALVEGYFDRLEFDSITFRTEPFTAVCAAGHRFVSNGADVNVRCVGTRQTPAPMSVKDLLGESLLVREPGSGTRDIFEKNLEAMNLSLSQFARITEIGSMHVILKLVAADLGISFMYRAAAQEFIDSGLLREIPLDDFHVTHDFAFIWNKGSIFADTYRQICREMMASSASFHLE